MDIGKVAFLVIVITVAVIGADKAGILHLRHVGAAPAAEAPAK
jgi:hypothetical protein